MPKDKFRLAWCPIDTDDLFSSAWFLAMKDFQQGWYLKLLFRCWENKSMPCHLRNDDLELRVNAAPTDLRQWESHKKFVLDRFLVTSDGGYIYNQKLLSVYQQQMEGYERRRAAGTKGGLAKASNARAMPQHYLAQQSISESDLKKELPLKTEIIKPVQAFTPLEVSLALCIERGWQGIEIRHCFSGAIDWLAARRNSSDYPILGKELLEAFEKHKAKNGKFAGKPKNFFADGTYQEYVVKTSKPEPVRALDIVKRQAAGNYD